MEYIPTMANHWGLEPEWNWVMGEYYLTMVWVGMFQTVWTLFLGALDLEMQLGFRNSIKNQEVSSDVVNPSK